IRWQRQRASTASDHFTHSPPGASARCIGPDLLTPAPGGGIGSTTWHPDEHHERRNHNGQLQAPRYRSGWVCPLGERTPRGYSSRRELTIGARRSARPASVRPAHNHLWWAAITVLTNARDHRRRSFLRLLPFPTETYLA